MVRRSDWMGPPCLFDGPSPYPHPHFPYVRVVAAQEDLTGIPFGLVRDMLFPQDNLNSTISKLRWGMSAVETIRTKGAVAMPDAQFRQMASRVDADFVLDANHMAQQGAKFERKRDFPIPNCGLSWVRWGQQRAILAWAETSHLEAPARDEIAAR